MNHLEATERNNIHYSGNKNELSRLQNTWHCSDIHRQNKRDDPKMKTDF